MITNNEQLREFVERVSLPQSWTFTTPSEVKGFIQALTNAIGGQNDK